MRISIQRSLRKKSPNDQASVCDDRLGGGRNWRERERERRGKKDRREGLQPFFSAGGFGDSIRNRIRYVPLEKARKKGRNSPQVGTTAGGE
jgi:hypothetical protein